MNDPPRDGQLGQLFAEARAAWPGIDVPFDLFAARLERAGAAALTSEGRAYASDLYLACACSDGNRAALGEFDRRYLGDVRAALARIDRSEDTTAEVLQQVRERLFVGADAKINEYRGSGPLAGWVRTVAVRTAFQLRRSAQVRDRHVRSVEPLASLFDAETAVFKQRHMGDVNAALRRALGELDAGDRLLLRLYYVEGLTLAKIGVIQQVGVSTVFRRLTAATQAVLARVKNELAEQLGLSAASLESLLRGAAREIDLSMSQMLGSG
jgi:RNA polymerase sigma-70 factor (ECF subfamily)